MVTIIDRYKKKLEQVVTKHFTETEKVIVMTTVIATVAVTDNNYSYSCICSCS